MCEGHACVCMRSIGHRATIRGPAAGSAAWTHRVSNLAAYAEACLGARLLPDFCAAAHHLRSAEAHRQVCGAQLVFATHVLPCLTILPPGQTAAPSSRPYLQCLAAPCRRPVCVHLGRQQSAVCCCITQHASRSSLVAACYSGGTYVLWCQCH